MSFENLRQIIIPDRPGSFSGFLEVKPGMIRSRDGSMWRFEKKIGSYTYNIKLISEDNKHYKLGFGTEEMGELLVNESMNHFVQVVDAIHELVDEVRKRSSLIEIRFGASLEGRTREGLQNLKSDLLRYSQENPEAFNGFDYDYDPALYITIKDGVAISGFRQSIEARGGSRTKENSHQKTLSEFLNDMDNSEAILKARPEIYFKLNAYVHHGTDPYEEQKPSGDIRKQKQRLMLYQRTLKNRFPEYEVSFDEEKQEIVVRDPHIIQEKLET